MLKTPRFYNEKYRRWVASLPCITCKIEGRTQCAHIRHQNGGGIGMKPEDKHCVPLCITCHQAQGERGEVRFWADRLNKAKETALKLFCIREESDRDISARQLIEEF